MRFHHPDACKTAMRCLWMLLVCWFSLGALQAIGDAQTADASDSAHSAHSANSAGAATYSLITQRDAMLALHGSFRFAPGDNPGWSDPGFDDSNWRMSRGDEDWKANGYTNLNGIAWYRFTVVLPTGNEPYSIRLPRIFTAYQLFVDGQLIFASGGMPPDQHMYSTVPEVIALPVRVRSGATALHFALRVWHDPVWSAYTPGGPQGAISIGRTSLINDRFASERLARFWRNSDWFDLTALWLFAAAGALALYLLGRSEREYLWFSILALGFALNHGVRLWARLNPHPVHLIESLESICYTTYLLASLMFYRKLLSGKNTRVFQAALLSCVLWFANTQLAIVPQVSAQAENTGELLFTFPVYAWILTLIYRRAKQRWPDARLLAIPVTLLVGTAFYLQLIFTINTYTHLDQTRYYPIIRGVFFADIKDIAEVFFLIAMLLILGNRFARTRRASDKTAAELEAARLVQRVLVPESLPQIPGLAIASAYYPAQQVGGDFFQIMPLSSGDTLVVIGDVAGKGVPAALTVSLIVGALRTLADFVDGPGEILAGLNRRLTGRSSGITTCLAMQFSADRQWLRIANAGHLPAYADSVELVSEANLPLGLAEDAMFAEVTYPLEHGQHIVVLTDGVPEAMHHRELFGFERTCALCGESASTIAEAARGFGQTDDITVLAIDVIQRQ